MVDTQAPYAATQDVIAAAQAREAAGAAQAAAINAAYMANTLPVLPKYAAGGGATYTAAELADAAAEQAKHEAAFHPTPINYAAYANVPLSQMPANVASRVQEYYTQNPSARAQAITQQYAAQSNRVISTGAGGETSVYQGAVKSAINPFDPNSALGIAWEVGKTGGATDTGLNVIALGQAADIKRETGRDIDTSFITFATNEYIQRPAFAERTQVGKSGMTIHENAWTPEPIRRNITLGEIAGGKFTGSFETGVHTAAGDWGGMYTPEATKSGVTSETPGRLRGSNLVAGLADTNYEVVSDKGRVKDTVKTYVPFGSYTQEELDNTKLAIDKKTGEVAIYQYNKSSDTWSLIGGGGRNALQSGMFSVEKAMTPFVTTQEDVGKYERPSGEGMARLGAEGYGGVVRALDDRTLAPNEAISRYSGSYGKFNLANFVDQVAAGKAEEPGAHIHWTLPGESPAIQYMDKGGIISGSAITVPSGGRLVGGKTIAGVATVTETKEGAGALPLPFKSTSAPSTATVAAREEYQPSGVLGLGGLLPDMPSAEKQKAFTTNLTGQIRADPFAASIKMASDIYAPPISTAAGVVSRLSFGASEIIFKPTPITVPGETKETAKTEVFQLPTTSATEITKLPESTTISGGNQTISALGGWLTGARGSIDTTNKTAVEEYNKKVDLFAKMQEQNPVFITTTGGTKATVTETGGTRTVTTTTGESASKVYASEWDRFVEGSGRVARHVLGTPMAKQEAYFETIKGEQGIAGEAKRGLYFVGTTITNKPAELAPAVVLGFGIRQAAAMAPGFLGEVAAGSGVTAKAAQFLQTPGGVSLAKAGMLGGFGGAYVYDVTDKLTATAEKTKENIYRSIPALAAMYAGGGGVDWVGETSVVRGTSAPSGATFSGVKVQDTYFGGGRTPTGQRYAGAFSPTESYVLSGKTTPPTGPATVPTPTGQLKLPSGSGGYGAETYPSSFEGPVRDYSKMDLSGGARPFTMKTAPEMQAASTAKFRDTSGAAQPFVIKTQAEAAARPAAEPAVSQLVGDFSGRAQPFTMKTAAEVKAGYWDVAEPIPRGDISGRGSKISLTTEREYLSGLPRDVSGKGEPFAARTQEEILSTWERERAATEQGAANIRWVGEVIRAKPATVTPEYELMRVPEGQAIPLEKIPSLSEDMFTAGAALSTTPRVIAKSKTTGEVLGAAAYRVVPAAEGKPSSIYIDYIGSGKPGIGSKLVGGIKTIAEEQGISTIAGKTVPRSAGFWERMGADVGATAEGGAPFEIGVGITKTQVSAKVEEPRKQYAEPRASFSIPGVSEAAISAELAGMHPALREQALGISKGRAPSTLLEREYPYTQIERDGLGRMGEEKRVAVGFPIPKRARKAIPKPSDITKVGESKRQKVVVSPVGGIIPETTMPPTKRTPSALPTKITTPKEPPTVTTKKTVEVVPYKTTTPRETQKTTTTTQPQEFPWTRTTERPAPTKTITKLPPATIPPLFPGLPSLGGGGGAGGGYKKGSRAYVEVLGFETSRGRKGAWTFGKRKAKK